MHLSKLVTLVVALGAFSRHCNAFALRPHAIPWAALKFCYCAQVVNVDDLNDILGARPYATAESRNIDKYRDGFDKPAVPVDTEPEQTPGDNSRGKQGGKAAPGDVVDGPDAPGVAPPTPTEVPGELPGVQPGPLAPSGKTVAS